MYVVRIEDLKEPLDEQNFIIAASPDPQSIGPYGDRGHETNRPLIMINQPHIVSNEDYTTA